MVRYDRLYNILKEMIKAAETKDSSLIGLLNDDFERLVPYLPNPPKKLTEYDNCRQSCFLSLQYPEMYEEFLDDAIKKFGNLPE